MATIRTSIMVHDGMSGALRHMNSALQSVVSTFEVMQATTSEAIDTHQFASAQRDIALATQALNQFEQAVDQAGNEQVQMNNQISSGAGAFKQLGGAILGAVGAYATFQQVGNLVNFATNYSNTTARIAMMNDGLQTTAKLQQEIYQAAQDSLSSYDATAALVTKLGNNAANAFSSSTEIVDFAELVQKQFAIAGTSAVEAENSVLQLSQALGSGVLRGDELVSISEQAPGIIQNIADYLKVPKGAIKDMASEGELTAEIVKEAIFAATDDINKQFGAMPLTWSDIWTTMVNYAQNKASGLAIRISDFFNSETFQVFQAAATKAIDVVIWGLHLIIMTLSGLAGWVATVGQFFTENWSWIAPMLIPIGVVLGSILAILVAKYTVLGLVRTATLAWAAAQWIVNAAFLANPITWGLIAIIAIIALVVYATYAWGEETATVVGFIVGLFAALVAFIHNNIANMVNAFLMFAEFLINLFVDPVYAIKKLFYDMAMAILNNMSSMGMQIDNVANAIGNAFVVGANMAIGAINWIKDALNEIPGIDLTKTSKLSMSGSSLGSKIANFAHNLEAPTSDSKLNPVSFKRMELLNVLDTASMGYDFGHSMTLAASDGLNGLVDKAQGLMKFDGGDQSSLGDLLGGYGLGNDNYMSGLNDALNGLTDAAKDTAKNTGKMADSASLTEDDIKYLRDQVTGKLINNINKSDIRLEMKNENHIHHDTDIDGIIDRFAEKAEELKGNLAEGGDYDDV